MTESPVVITTSDTGVATVRLNRPDDMNAVNVAMKVALRDGLTEVADDDAVRCVVLTGSGRAFCVGQDLREHVENLRRGDESLSTTVEEHYNPIVATLATMNKPVIAAINGVAAGAGASFAMACDIRVIVDTAGFNMAFAGIALSCDSGSSFWLPRLVGMNTAKDLLFNPRTVPAAECLEIGLVTHVVAPDDLESTVTGLAERFAAGPTQAYGSIRRVLRYSSTHTLDESLAHEAKHMAFTGATADHAAAVDAFLAKEKPTFTGR